MLSGQNHLIRLEDLIAEHLDHLHYLNDILLLNIGDLNDVLADNLLHRLITPLYLHSFLSCLKNNNNNTGDSHNQSKHRPPFPVSDSEALAGQLPPASLSPTVALFLLTQAYLIFSYGPLLGRLVGFLLRSTRADIEFNVRKCEFAPPEETLEQALVAAKSNTIAGNGQQQQQQQQQSSSALATTTEIGKVGTKEKEEEEGEEDEPMDVQKSSTAVIFPAAAPPAPPNAVLKPKKSDFKPSFFASGGPAKPPPISALAVSAVSSPSFSTSHSTSSAASSTVSLAANPATAASVPMDVDQANTTTTAKSASEPAVPVMTIRNWPEYPFLIAFLSTLNSSISNSNGHGGSGNLALLSTSASSASLAATSSASGPLSHPNSRSNSIPTGVNERVTATATAATPTSSTGGDSRDTALLANSCHSPTVSRSIVELSSADDRLILFTLSLIASILENKSKFRKNQANSFLTKMTVFAYPFLEIDLANYCGVFVPPAADASPSDSEATNSYCSALLNSLLLIMRHCTSSSKLRKLRHFSRKKLF